MKFLVKATGLRITGVLTGGYETAPDGFVWVETDADDYKLLTEYALVNDQLVFIGPAPGPYYTPSTSGDDVIWVPDVPVLKADLQRQVDIERTRRNLLPIMYAGSTFDADEIAQRNVSAWQTQLSAGATLPSDFTWRDYNNNDHPADAEFVNGLGAAITLRGTQLYQASWQHKSDINSATEQELLTYDISKYWV